MQVHECNDTTVQKWASTAASIALRTLWIQLNWVRVVNISGPRVSATTAGIRVLLTAVHPLLVAMRSLPQSGMPVPHWWPPWRTFQNREYCLLTGTRSLHVSGSPTWPEFWKKIEDTRQQHGPDVCLPQRLFYFLTPQKGNSPDHGDLPG